MLGDTKGRREALEEAVYLFGNMKVNGENLEQFYFTGMRSAILDIIVSG